MATWASIRRAGIRFKALEFRFRRLQAALHDAEKAPNANESLIAQWKADIEDLQAVLNNRREEIVAYLLSYNTRKVIGINSVDDIFVLSKAALWIRGRMFVFTQRNSLLAVIHELMNIEKDAMSDEILWGLESGGVYYSLSDGAFGIYGP